MAKINGNFTLQWTALAFICLFFLCSNETSSQDNVKSDELEFPLRGAFYYSWYPQTWTVNGKHVFYKPELGYYNSDDEKVVEQHIEDMDYAKIDVAIASWWGISKHNQAIRFPMMLNKTIEVGSKLKWAIYYEKEGFGNPNVGELQSDLEYLMEKYADHKAFARINDKPVIFVYNANDNSCEVADRWALATKGEWFVCLKVFGGYKNCVNQPDTWHQYGPATVTQQHQGYSFVISPGFWRADETSARLERDSVRWYKNVRDMVASKEPWQLITTFNEWGEGTATERCYDWQSNSKFGTYLDALHTDGVIQPFTSLKDNLNISKVHFYHNPVREQLTISNSNEVKMVDIYNVTGSLLKRIRIQKQGSFEIRTHELSRGVYLLKISLLSGEIQAGKFLK